MKKHLYVAILGKFASYRIVAYSQLDAATRLGIYLSTNKVSELSHDYESMTKELTIKKLKSDVKDKPGVKGRAQ